MRNIDRSRGVIFDLSVIFALAAYLIATSHALQVGDRFFLDDSIASELEDWEVRWLRDAVRRGRAFVSKGIQRNGEIEDDDWDSFVRSVQAKNAAASRPAAIPAAESSFMGSFGGAPGPSISIGPSGSGPVSAFSGSGPASTIPGVSSAGQDTLFFGNFDPNQFMQPVVVQQQHPNLQQLQQPERPVPMTPPPSHQPHRPRPIPRRITTTTHRPPPPSRSEPTDEEYAQLNSLDSILRTLISRRQQIIADEDGLDLQQLQQPTAARTTTTTAAAAAARKRRPMRPLKNIITEETVKDRKKATAHHSNLPGHPPNEWVMMNPDDDDPEGEDSRVPDQLPVPTVLQEREQLPAVLHDQQEHVIDRVEEMNESIDSLHTADPEEEKIRALSNELTDLIMKMKRRKKEPKVKKKPAKARVIVIRNGTAEGLANRQYNLIATITLIRDGGKNILVDTGLATDINGRTEMIRRLESLGVPTPAVHVVVSTHGHPDHAGNSHLFPDAVHYHGWYVHERTVFNLSNLFDSDREQISPSVSLLRTPGHTSEDVSVLIRDGVNEYGSPLGNVAVAGDVFVRREDIENDREWVPLSADVKSQALSRRTLLCKSDCIVPGHGPPFRVDSQLRAHFKC